MMSQRGGTRGPQDGRQKLVWAGLFLVASVVGGLAAGDLGHVPAWKAVLVSVAIAAVVTLVVEYIMPPAKPTAIEGGRRGGSPEMTAPGGAAPGGQVSGNPGPVPRHPAPPLDPAVVRLMQQPAPSDNSWWQPGHGPASRTTKAEAPGARKLSSYMDAALIAQCPDCGSFRLDAQQGEREWHFRCQECRQTWNWLPGSPWPAVHVRPRLRKGQHRPQP